MIAFADINIPFIKEALGNKVDVRIAAKSDFTRENLIKNQVKAIFIRSTVKVFRELLDGTSVEFVGTATSGTDHLDVDYLNKISLPFFSAPGSNANSVAEYVIYSVLKWNLLTNSVLQGKKIGVIGYGNIGKLVAKYASLLGMQVLVNDPPLEKENYDYPNYTQRASLWDIITHCDIVTNHVPLTFSGEFPTHNLLNSELLSKLKKDSLFIHTSRGKVVEEAALKELVENQQIHLAIDVWENEPKFDSTLVRKALLATPHLAGYSYDAKLKGAMMILKKFEEHFGIQPDYKIFEKYLTTDTKNLYLDFSSPIKIFKLLRQRRALETDSHNFLEFVDVGDEEKEKAFVELRKNYPKRRETLLTKLP